MLRYAWIPGAIGFVFAMPLQAQTVDQTQIEDRLDPVTVTGLRPVAPDDVTSSVTTLDAADLAVRDPIALADQLRGVPGVGVSRSGALGGLTQVRVRGAEANHTLVLIDGIEVSDPTTGETDFGLFSQLPVARIEFVRGEQSSLYGSDAIGGVMSVQTGMDTLSAQIEAGSFDTYRGQLSVGTEIDRSSLGAALSAFSTDGVDTSGREGETDGSDSLGLLLQGHHDFFTGWQLSGLATYRQSNVQTDPDLDFDGRLDNADRETETDQYLVGASLSGDGAGLNHVLRASYNDVERENTADGQFSDRTVGERTKVSYSPSKVFETSAATITTSGLVDFENEDYTRIGTATAFGDPNQSQTFDTFGVAGEVQALLGALTVTASARHDDNDGRFDDATTWRVGAAYGFDFGGKFRASVGTGVKNPTFTELFGFFPGSFVGNPDLEPERSTSWEVGWDQIYGQASWSVTYFSASLVDEIFTAFDANFFSTPQNRAGDSERSGVEMAGRYRVSDAISLRGSVSRIQSENDQGEDEIRVPELTGSVAVDWQSQRKEGLTAGIAFDYVGEQLDTDFGTFQTVTLDDYWLMSATLAYPLSERVSVTVRGDNLLNEDAVDVFGFNAPGPGIYVGLKVR